MPAAGRCGPGVETRSSRWRQGYNAPRWRLRSALRTDR